MSNQTLRDINQIIIEEGIEARNFVSWRVPKHINGGIPGGPGQKEGSIVLPSGSGVDRDRSRRDDAFDVSKDAIARMASPVTVASMRLWKLIFTNVCRSVEELHRFLEEEQNVDLSEQSFQFFLGSCRDFALLTQRLEKDRQDKDSQLSTFTEKDKEKTPCEDNNVNGSGARRIPLILRSPKRETATAGSVKRSTQLRASAAPFFPTSSDTPRHGDASAPSQTPTPIHAHKRTSIASSAEQASTPNPNSNNVNEIQKHSVIDGSSTALTSSTAAVLVEATEAATIVAPHVITPLLSTAVSFAEESTLGNAVNIPSIQSRENKSLSVQNEVGDENSTISPPVQLLDKPADLILAASNETDKSMVTISSKAVDETDCKSNKGKVVTNTPQTKSVVAPVADSSQTKAIATAAGTNTSTDLSNPGCLSGNAIFKFPSIATASTSKAMALSQSQQQKKKSGLASPSASIRACPRPSLPSDRRMKPASFGHGQVLPNQPKSRSALCDLSESSVDSVDPCYEEQVLRESEAVWAQVEAWIDAEVAVEEEAWAALLGEEKGQRDRGTESPKSSHMNLNQIESDEAATSEATVPSTTPSTSSSSRSGKPNLQVSPTAEYIGMSTTSDSSTVKGVKAETQIPENNQALTEAGLIRAGNNLGPFSGPMSPTTFLESSFLRDHLPPGISRSHSPDRHLSQSRSPRATAADRMSAAEVNRDRSVEERKQKARIVSHRAKVITEKKAVRLARAEAALSDKLLEAQKRHEDYVRAIKGRAGNENAKVSEVMFINTMNEENLVLELQQRLEEVEARIKAADNRRHERLRDISVQQRHRNHRKSQQMSDVRLRLEQQRMERWEKLQCRIAAVQNRREVRLLELSRRSAGMGAGLGLGSFATESLCQLEIPSPTKRSQQFQNDPILPNEAVVDASGQVDQNECRIPAVESVMKSASKSAAKSVKSDSDDVQSYPEYETIERLSQRNNDCGIDEAVERTKKSRTKKKKSRKTNLGNATINVAHQPMESSNSFILEQTMSAVWSKVRAANTMSTQSQREPERPEVTLSNYIDRLERSLLAQETLLMKLFPKYGSSQFRGTILKHSLPEPITSNGSINYTVTDMAEARLQHLWSCSAQVLGALTLHSEHSRKNCLQESGGKLLELLTVLMEGSHWNNPARLTHCLVHQPDTLLIILTAFRYCLLDDDFRAAVLEMTTVTSAMTDLAHMLLLVISGNGNFSHDNSSDRVSLTQCLSFLLNSVYMLLLHIPVTGFKLDPPLMQIELDHKIQTRFQLNKWKDGQTALIEHIWRGGSGLVDCAMWYLETQGGPSLRAKWSKRLISGPGTELCERLRGWTFLPIDPDVEKSPESGSSEDGSATWAAAAVAEYDLTCGCAELCLGLTSYIRFSAGIGPQTLIRTHDQLHNRKHRHIQGRQIVAALISGGRVVQTMTALLRSCIQLHAANQNDGRHSVDFFVGAEGDSTWDPAALLLSSDGGTHPFSMPSQSVYTLIQLCLETILNTAETDVNVFRQSPRKTKLELLNILGVVSISCGGYLVRHHKRDYEDKASGSAEESAAVGQSKSALVVFGHTLHILCLLYLPSPTEISSTLTDDTGATNTPKHVSEELLTVVDGGLSIPNHVLESLDDIHDGLSLVGLSEVVDLVSCTLATLLLSIRTNDIDCAKEILTAKSCSSLYSFIVKTISLLQESTDSKSTISAVQMNGSNSLHLSVKPDSASCARLSRLLPVEMWPDAEQRLRYLSSVKTTEATVYNGVLNSDSE